MFIHFRNEMCVCFLCMCWMQCVGDVAHWLLVAVQCGFRHMESRMCLFHSNIIQTRLHGSGIEKSVFLSLSRQQQQQHTTQLRFVCVYVTVAIAIGIPFRLGFLIVYCAPAAVVVVAAGVAAFRFLVLFRLSSSVRIESNTPSPFTVLSI